MAGAEVKEKKAKDKKVKKDKKDKVSKKDKKEKKEKKSEKKRKRDSAEAEDAAPPAKEAKAAEPAAEPELVADMNAAPESAADMAKRMDIRITGEDAPGPCSDFSLFPKKIVAMLEGQGFTAPSPIQCASWPTALAGRDVVAIAKTGSGKTLGYALPAMMYVGKNRSFTKWGDAPLAMCLAPTRELVCQIEVECNKVAASCGLRVGCVYGGVPRGEQIRVCRGGLDMLIATPGRLLDFSGYGQVSLKEVAIVILDEADRMLDMGFEDDIRKIMGSLEKYQTLLYSATWPKKVRKLASEFLKNPVSVHIGDTSNQLVASKNVTQVIKVVGRHDKTAAFKEILAAINTEEDGSKKARPAKVIIFSATKRFCDQLADLCYEVGHKARSIHGDLTQDMRDRVLHNFRNNSVRVLVATDVAARGLDIPDIEYVINYDFPGNIEDYIHRIGRTGRGDRKGTAYSLFSPDKDSGNAADHVKILTNAGAEVPTELDQIASRRGGRGGGRGGGNRRWGRGGGNRRGGGRGGGGRGGGGRRGGGRGGGGFRSGR